MHPCPCPLVWIICSSSHAKIVDNSRLPHELGWWRFFKDQSELGIFISLSVCNHLCTQKTPQESYKNSYKNSSSHSSQEMTIIITPRGSLVHRKWHSQSHWPISFKLQLHQILGDNSTILSKPEPYHNCWSIPATIVHNELPGHLHNSFLKEL